MPLSMERKRAKESEEERNEKEETLCDDDSRFLQASQSASHTDTNESERARARIGRDPRACAPFFSFSVISLSSR